MLLSNNLSPSSESRNKPGRIPARRMLLDYIMIQKYVLLLYWIWPRKDFIGETAGSFLHWIVACSVEQNYGSLDINYFINDNYNLLRSNIAINFSPVNSFIQGFSFAMGNTVTSVSLSIRLKPQLKQNGGIYPQYDKPPDEPFSSGYNVLLYKSI
jgi:hypothetical protein